jgi:hypothetical protein
MLRDLRINKVPMSQVSTTLNLQASRVERSQNPIPWELIFLQVSWMYSIAAKIAASNPASAPLPLLFG